MPREEYTSSSTNDDQSYQLAMNHLLELERYIDIHSISYRNLGILYVNYCNNILLSEDSLDILEIIPMIRVVCKFLVQQAGSYLQNEISKNELEKFLEFTHNLMDSMEDECREWTLINVVVHLLYNAEDSYDAEQDLLVFYDRLIDLDHSQQLCKRLTDYITSVACGRT
jgi:hypothetical protein